MSLEKEPFLTPQHTMPDDGPDAGAYWTVLRSLPDTIRELMASVETADLINTVQKMHRLNEQQRVGLAEFIRDLLLGISMPDNVAGYLAESLGIEQASATQILKNIESTLLTKAGMSIASIGRASSGPSLEERDGRVLLKFATLDDLLASIEGASPADRVRFLEDAKKDNRILVLKALSQLKLGTDGSGKPMTFSQLLAQEAPDFSAQDWVDALLDDNALLAQPAVKGELLTFMANSGRLRDLVSLLPNTATARLFHDVLPEALAQAKPSVIEHVRFSPYFAGIFDREQGVNEALFDKYHALDHGLRERLASDDLSQKVADLVRDGTIPEEYGVAVAKTLFLVELGDLSASSLGELFGTRLNLGAEKGNALAERIKKELLSSPEVAAETSPLRSSPTPPPELEKPRIMPSGSSSNVVDLKKPT